MTDIDVAQRLRRDVPLMLALGFGTPAFVATVASVRTHGWGWDAHAYYLAARDLDYSRLPNTVDAYLYSPVFAQALHPLAMLPWPVFAALWSLAAALTLTWLVRGVWWPLRLALLFFSSWEVASGNIALGVPLGLATISYGFDPRAWHAWFDLLTQAATQQASAPPYVPPFIVRAPLAVALTGYAAWTSRAWLVAVAACLASPNWWLPATIILFAIPTLRQQPITPGGCRV